MDIWGADDRAALIALLLRASSPTVRQQVTRRADEAGSALAVLREELGQPTLLDDPVDGALADARQQIEAWQSSGITVLSFGDPGYPTRLRDVHDMPGVLFAQGTLRPDDPGIAIVGSRRASPAGLRTANELARRLAKQGTTVVSGLAAGGRTVGVIGTGIRHAYPPENRQLHSEVAAAGLVLSQFWPDTPADRHTFPARNATMSGYAMATVIVEAGERSGARIQARQAIEHGRPVVLLHPVVTGTGWGREYADRPDVHIARDVAEAQAIAEELIARPNEVHDLLGSLAATL